VRKCGDRYAERGDHARPTTHMTDKNSHDINPSGSKPGADDLTCSEGQLEDLLANGESTETELDDEERAENPSMPKSASRERKARGKPAQESKSKQQ